MSLLQLFNVIYKLAKQILYSLDKAAKFKDSENWYFPLAEQNL